MHQFVQDAETQRQLLDLACHEYDQLVSQLLENSVQIADQVVHSRQDSIGELLEARKLVVADVQRKMQQIDRLYALCDLFGV